MIEINKNYNESNLETMAKMPDNFVDLGTKYCSSNPPSERYGHFITSSLDTQ